MQPKNTDERENKKYNDVLKIPKEIPVQENQLDQMSIELAEKEIARIRAEAEALIQENNISLH